VELAGKIPMPKEKIDFENFTFTVELSDRRRVRRVKVSRKEPVITQ
jgi:CBS domain containing-hemolysin-like protein